MRRNLVSKNANKSRFVCTSISGSDKLSCKEVKTPLVGNGELCDPTPIEWTGGCGAVVDLGCNPTEAQILAALDVSQVSAITTCTEDGGYVNIVGDSDIRIAKNGCYTTATRIYTATDACGNVSTCIRTAKYRDDADGPTITVLQEGVDPYLGCNPTPEQIEAALGQATYEDECDCVEHDAQYRDGPIQETDCGRSKTRYWTAVDDCGSPASAERTVYWSSDTTPPIIIPDFPEPTVELGCNPTQYEIYEALGHASVQDNCGATEYEEYGPVIPLENCEFSQTIYWTAIDDCGNEAEPKQRTAYWKVDTEGPIIKCPVSSGESIPVDKIIGCDEKLKFDIPEVYDGCGGEVQLISVDEVITIHCRTWIATDECGNTSTCKQCIAVDSCQGKGCTIGYWKNHPEVWANAGSPFLPGDDFYAFFGIAPGSGGLPSPLTMMQALNLGGGGCFNLARQGVAALLNASAFGPDYEYPAPSTDFVSLKAAIASALLSGVCGTLASKLDSANNGDDPSACEALKRQVVTAVQKKTNKVKSARQVKAARRPVLSNNRQRTNKVSSHKNKYLPK